MRNKEYFKNKKITIVGLARSGVACANLLYKLGAILRVTDIKDDSATRGACAKLCSKKILVELGKHSRYFISQADLVVISPGVPEDSPPVKWAKEFKKPVVSEIEIASILCPAEIIAITGSNGKTTVTTLIGKILQAAKKKVFVCGNIGNPFCAGVWRMQKGDFVVLEVSSFQLEAIRDFKPKIAVILNLTPNHLDRYRNMSQYCRAKKRIFMNQDKDDFLILNADDPVLKKIGNQANSKVIYFTKNRKFNPNQSAVFSAGRVLGIDERLMLKVFSEFKGIEHRMEELPGIKRVRFINDSKATTADSAIWAINNINTPIILIAGGRHKGIDYRVILKPARGKIKRVILIGEAKEKIALDLKGKFPVEMALNLEDAVNRASACALPGYAVLFSPMCSSFDMFTDYQERGRVFKRIVSKLVSKS